MLPQPRVLLVMDRQPETALVRELLQKHTALTCAGSIPELRSLIRKAEYDSLFCPRSFPAGTWREVLGVVGAESPSLPVIVLSLQGNEGVWLEALDAGAFDWLTLPIPPQALLGVVEQAAASRQARTRWTSAQPATV